MSGFKPTKLQEQAINTFNCNVSISAGAGSGKTEVLVRRFCNIVEQNMARVNEILTVTFTEKAAKEMKQRIVRRFDELYQETHEKRFEEARREVESAYIGTIHSFAARVLRENALEAGIDPRYRMLTETEAATLHEEVLADMLSAGYSGGSKGCIGLLLSYGRETVKTAIKDLYNYLCASGKDISEVMAAPANIEKPRKYMQEYIALVDELISNADTYTPALAKKLNDFIPLYSDLKGKMQAFCDLFDTKDPSSYAADFDWDLYEELSIAEDFVDGRAGSKDIQNDYIKPAKAAAQSLRKALVNPVAIHYIGCLRELTGAFIKDYADAKRRVGALDFNDLLLFTRNLFIDKGKPTGMAAEYQEKFKFVVMDEFQDTNSLQKSIIDAVCRPERLFTVGDVKQSIFGFQQSDVDVFIDHHESIKADPASSALALVENFRSRKDIIGFVNNLFEKIWDEDGEFEFEKLEALGDFHDKDTPDVELLMVQKSGGVGGSRLMEARAIAAKINELLGRNGKPALHITKKSGDPEPREIKPGDIMMLFRSTTGISIYERALHEAGIEYYVVSGRGFYKTHEVQDILNILKVVNNPLDDIAMAAVLRSPLVAVSDDALWWLTRDSGSEDDSPENDEPDVPLTRNKNIGKLYSGLQNVNKLTALDNAARQKLAVFSKLLAKLHRMSSESRITDLICTALKETRYTLKLLASPNGKRRYANVRKLIEVAEEFQSGGLFTLPEFIGHIESMVVMADREGEAPTETEESPVVRLMTVHKSKGLQAPVVFVADCSRGLKTGDPSAFITAKDAGIACKIRNPITDAWMTTPAYSSVSDAIKQKDIGEEKRLFYVAATRAEELLILSGCSDYMGKAIDKGSYRDITSWSGWLEKALAIDSAPGSSGKVLSMGGVNVRLISGCAGEVVLDLPKPVSIVYAGRLSAGKKLPIGDGDGLGIIKRCSEVCTQCSDMPLTLSVSRLLDYSECPRKYQLKWILGAQESSETDPDYTPEANYEFSASDLGSAVHQVMGSIDFTGDIQEQIRSRVNLQQKKYQKAVLNCCNKFVGSEWLDRIKKADQWLREVPFSINLDHCIISGRIDLLFRDKSGWVVVDYKTGSASEDERYRMQVGVYALAVDMCLGTVPSEVALISLGKGLDYREMVEKSLINETRSQINLVSKGINSGKFNEIKSMACLKCRFGEGVCIQG